MDMQVSQIEAKRWFPLQLQPNLKYHQRPYHSLWYHYFSYTMPVVHLTFPTHKRGGYFHYKAIWSGSTLPFRKCSPICWYWEISKRISVSLLLFAICQVQTTVTWFSSSSYNDHRSRIWSVLLDAGFSRVSVIHQTLTWTTERYLFIYLLKAYSSGVNHTGSPA